MPTGPSLTRRAVHLLASSPMRLSTNSTGGSAPKLRVLTREDLGAALRNVRRQWYWVLGVLAVVVAAGISIASVSGALTDQSISARVKSGAVGILVLSGVLFFGSRLVSGDWFHPLAFPLAYTALTLVGPALFIVLTEVPLATI